jgi:hypothetical protein
MLGQEHSDGGLEEHIIPTPETMGELKTPGKIKKWNISTKLEWYVTNTTLKSR